MLKLPIISWRTSVAPWLMQVEYAPDNACPWCARRFRDQRVLVHAHLPSLGSRDVAFPLRCLRPEIALPGVQGRKSRHVSALPAMLDTTGGFSLGIRRHGSLRQLSRQSRRQADG